MSTLPAPSRIPGEFFSGDMFPDEEGEPAGEPSRRHFGEPMVEGGEDELIAQIEGYTDAKLRERLAPLLELFEEAPEDTRRIILNEIERVAHDITNPEKAIEARLAVAQKWFGKLQANLKEQK